MQTVSRFSEIDRSQNVKARLRLSKVSILGYFFNTACLKLFGFCIWDSIRSIETIKKDRSTIRLSTRGCTDLNMITSMLVCVQGLSLYQSSRLSLEKKKRKEIKLNYPILCAWDFWEESRCLPVTRKLFGTDCFVLYAPRMKNYPGPEVGLECLLIYVIL